MKNNVRSTFSVYIFAGIAESYRKLNVQAIPENWNVQEYAVSRQVIF
ncbi:MAG: hypothetical protein K2H89_01670 [Oscillospiraceae bacterium]|nr:hypothetical protein [Oscillospiraceae bacterium]